MRLAGQRILVTGGAVRIGRAICSALAEAGASVVIHCRRSLSAAQELATALGQGGRRAWVLQADLADGRACEELIGRAWELAGGLEGLVNNAAVFWKDSLARVDATWAELGWKVNFWAALTLLRRFAERAERGCVVNLLDARIAGYDRGTAFYSLSKKALAEATRMAAMEFAPRVRVNAVAPGAVLPPRGAQGEPVHERAAMAALGRGGTPEEVAAAVRFLFEQEAVTGQVLFVDGGQHLRGEDHA